VLICGRPSNRCPQRSGGDFSERSSADACDEPEAIFARNGFVEAATGLCLLFLPAVLFAVLFGLKKATVDAIFVGRVAVAALL
jgi:hypothetical protein